MDDDTSGHFFFTVPQVQRRTGISRRQINRAIRAGEIDVYSIGQWPRLRWADVLVWIEAQRRSSGGQSGRP